jgi:aldehyde dehydrogenase (NAD+)
MLSLRQPDRLFIGGDWVEPHSTQPIDIVSPDTGLVIGQVAQADRIDVGRAVAAARTAFDEGPWPTTPVAERVAVLERLARSLRRREGDLIAAIQAQIGALPARAPVMTRWGIESFERYAELGKSFAFEEKRTSAVAEQALVVQEPVGVVACIAPWNAPLMSMASKVAPALLAGCTVIMKPASETPVEAFILAECAQEAGVPPGVINLVTARRDAADDLVSNPAVDKVAFTGSTGVGRRIAQLCGERFARYTLELGGKSAAIVLDDFDIAEAGRLLARTITAHTGQICATMSRAIVPKARHDALAAAIAAEMQSMRVSYSHDPSADMGPVALKRQLESIESYIAIGLAEKATLACGGHRPPGLEGGYFIAPTLFSNVTPDMRIAQEEIFGPVLALMPCEDVEDAIRIANSTVYGLSGSVITRDPEQAYRIARRLRTGAVGQNGLRSDFSLPFGGVGHSGVGREGGAQGLQAYLETKTLLLDAPA